MKSIFTVLVIISFMVTQASSKNYKTPNSVDHLNMNKFSGLWYEIARTYNSFEKDCVGATVEYILSEPLKYDIKNRCFDTTFEGKLIEYNGTASPSNSTRMSEIDMTYFWIFTKKYKIIYLEKNYTTAILVDNDMEHIWIMNREPLMKDEKLESLVSFLKNYMDTSKLIYTPQDKQGRYK